MPIPVQPSYLPVAVISVAPSSLPGQSFRESGNFSVGPHDSGADSGWGYPTASGYTVSLFDSSGSPLSSDAKCDVEVDVIAGKDHRLWSDVANNSIEPWETDSLRRVYCGGANDNINDPFYLELYATYNGDQLSGWKTGQPIKGSVDGLLSSVVSLTGGIPGQSGRSSGNFNSQAVSGSPSTITFQIRTALVNVDPWDCPEDTSATVNINEDISGGTDPTIWKGVTNGTQVDYSAHTNLYVSSPENAQSNFHVLMYVS